MRVWDHQVIKERGRRNKQHKQSATESQLGRWKPQDCYRNTHTSAISSTSKEADGNNTLSSTLSLQCNELSRSSRRWRGTFVRCNHPASVDLGHCIDAGVRPGLEKSAWNGRLSDGHRAGMLSNIQTQLSGFPLMHADLVLGDSVSLHCSVLLRLWSES